MSIAICTRNKNVEFRLILSAYPCIVYTDKVYLAATCAGVILF